MSEQKDWTPERVLAMLRDLSNDAIEGPAFLAKWGSDFDPEQLAMDAIEREKARADAAERERDCYLSQCDYYKDDLDAIRAMVPNVKDTATQELVQAHLKELNEKLNRLNKQCDELIRIKTGNDPNELLCCNDMMCGCQRVTVREYELHFIDRAIEAKQKGS